jgi:hypothetical protein
MLFGIKGDLVIHLESCGIASRTPTTWHKADLPPLFYLIFSLPTLTGLGHHLLCMNWKSAFTLASTLQHQALTT